MEAKAEAIREAQPPVVAADPGVADADVGGDADMADADLEELESLLTSGQAGDGSGASGEGTQDDSAPAARTRKLITKVRNMAMEKRAAGAQGSKKRG